MNGKGDYNFGMEIFQYTLSQVLQGLKGVRNMADDSLIFASIKEADNAALEASCKD